MSLTTPTLLVMAGGTGGHVFPGLAVAEHLRARHWKVVWLGVASGMEATLVPQHGIPMETVAVAGVRGKGLLAKLLLPLNLLRAFWQSLQVLRRVRPHVVLGMGGYVAFPGGMMAALLGRPLVVHEQNSVAGLTNRLLAGVADRVLVAFPDAIRGAQWTGNPIRGAITAVAEPRQRFAGRSGPLRVLVVGGSLGAQALNETVPRALALLPVESRPAVMHQAGRRQIEALRSAYAAAGIAPGDAPGQAQPVDFIDDMAHAYAHADLVICRAGAMTVAELAAAGVASVLVPYPHAVDDHQTTNARFLSERGAAVLMPQATLTPETLAGLLQDLDRPRLLAMAEAARAQGRPQAAADVAAVCEAICKPAAPTAPPTAP